MEQHELKGTIEAMLFASDAPLAIEQIRDALEHVSKAEIQAVLEALRADYDASGRGLKIEEVAGGVRLYTRPEYSQWVRRLVRTRHERRFSAPALETLAIVAYKQPLTKAEIEMIRGVNSDGVLETLLERGLVKIRGRREGLGRPILYGTTQGFLEYFGLGGLEDLPDWKTGTAPSAPPGQPLQETERDEKDEQKEPVQQASDQD